MQYEVEIQGRLRKVTLTSVGDSFAIAIDGRTWQVDAARIDAHTFSLLVGKVWPESDTRQSGVIGSAAAHSYEVAVAPELGPGFLTVRIGAAEIPAALGRRRRRKDEAAHGVDGPQRILAPMPGKIVRLLVKTGEAVRARQPLVVVEAMKMENELRARGDGTVSRIHVQEGASVEAGALLVVLE